MSAESPTTKQESLTVAFDGPVATLTLQHGSMNAIDDALLDALAGTFAMVETHSEVSVLRIRSERRVFFCRGGPSPCRRTPRKRNRR